MLAFLIFLFVSFLAGSVNPPLVKLAGHEIPALTFNAVRLILSTLILLPIWLREKTFVRKKDIIKLLPLPLNIAFYGIALQYTSLIAAGVLGLLIPIIVAILGYFLMKETVLRSQIIGFLVAFIGVVILVYGSIEKQDIRSFGTPLGNGLIFAGFVFFSLYALGTRSMSKLYSPNTILFSQVLTGAILLGILAPFEWQVRPVVSSDITIVGILSVFGLGISTVVFYFLYQWLIKYKSAFVATLTSYTAIIFQTGAGISIFHEHLTTQLFFGSVLIVVGSFYAVGYEHIKKYKNRTAVLQ